MPPNFCRCACSELKIPSKWRAKNHGCAFYFLSLDFNVDSQDIFCHISVTIPELHACLYSGNLLNCYVRAESNRDIPHQVMQYAFRKSSRCQSFCVFKAHLTRRHCALSNFNAIKRFEPQQTQIITFYTNNHNIEMCLNLRTMHRYAAIRDVLIRKTSIGV